MDEWHFLSALYEVIAIPYFLYQKIDSTLKTINNGKNALEEIALGENVQNYKEQITELRNNRFAFFLLGGRKTLYNKYLENRLQRKRRNLNPSNHLSQAK